MYHLQFSLQAASPDTFGYTLVVVPPVENNQPSALIKRFWSVYSSASVGDDHVFEHKWILHYDNAFPVKRLSAQKHISCGTSSRTGLIWPYVAFLFNFPKINFTLKMF
jgi:hypothetical protein